MFGYGAVGSAGCISVELLGCLPRDLSYPIHTSNLLQYRLSLPDNLCANCTGVEHGYWYGSDGVLTDGELSVSYTGYRVEYRNKINLTLLAHFWNLLESSEI